MHTLLVGPINHVRPPLCSPDLGALHLSHASALLLCYSSWSSQTRVAAPNGAGRPREPCGGDTLSVTARLKAV